MAEYDESLETHVSALAKSLGIGELEWTTRQDPDNHRMTILVCRRPDGREYTMPSLSISRRDGERFVVGVSRSLLADVVSGVA